MSLTAQTWLAASLVCLGLLIVLLVGLALAAWVNERRLERDDPRTSEFPRYVEHHRGRP